MVSVVIHSNPHLSNQIESAGWLKQGFERHGLDCEITANRIADADIHVVQGPHYAFDCWVGKPNVIWLNRGYYGDSRFDLSIGWLNADGSRNFKNKNMTFAKAPTPELKPLKPEQKAAVVFADYGRMVEAKHWTVDAREKYFPVYMHEHPADSPCDWGRYTLDDLWERCDVAIGGASTVLVKAALNGLHIAQCDPTHVCADMADREQWLMDLSWAMWNHSEICQGDFWEHLC